MVVFRHKQGCIHDSISRVQVGRGINLVYIAYHYSVTDQWTDGWTDRLTDRLTDQLAV